MVNVFLLLSGKVILHWLLSDLFESQLLRWIFNDTNVVVVLKINCFPQILYIKTEYSTVLHLFIHVWFGLRCKVHQQKWMTFIHLSVQSFITIIQSHIRSLTSFKFIRILIGFYLWSRPLSHWHLINNFDSHEPLLPVAPSVHSTSAQTRRQVTDGALHKCQNLTSRRTVWLAVSKMMSLWWLRFELSCNWLVGDGVVDAEGTL